MTGLLLCWLEKNHIQGKVHYLKVFDVVGRPRRPDRNPPRSSIYVAPALLFSSPV